MSIEESPHRRRAIQTQRGRKTRKLGGTLQRFWASHRSVRRVRHKASMARQPKGEYASVPDTVVDHRPPVCQKPLTASAPPARVYYKLNVFVMATRRPRRVGASESWARKRRLRDPARDRRVCRPRGLAPPEGARRHGERPDRPRSPNPALPACRRLLHPRSWALVDRVQARGIPSGTARAEMAHRAGAALAHSSPIKPGSATLSGSAKMAPRPSPKSCHFVPNRGILS